MGYPLGLIPPNPEDVQLKLSEFADFSRLPKPPKVFGHGLDMAWGMLGNNSVGDCVIAGGMHEEMLWAGEVGAVPPFTAQAAIAQYSEITGYSPNIPFSDRGTDMKVAANFRRQIGLKDANGDRHKIDAYLRIDDNDLDHLFTAAFVFGAVGLGAAITFAAESQFQAGEPWDVRLFAPVKGMHYIPLVGRNSAGHGLIVTWGRLHAVKPEWLRVYVSMALAYISPVPFKDGKTLEGFNRDDLNSILASL